MADGYLSSIKMKRKDLDDVSDDFSDFSLSSPARKIRRLDIELPPIMEEEEPEIPPLVDQPPVASAAGGIEEEPPMISSELNENPERALVVFKNVNTHPLLQHSPSNLTVSVDSHFISGFKNQYLWSSGPGSLKSSEEERAATNNSMAVVPWVPSQFLLAQSTDLSREEAPELMDDEQVGESSMEIEGDTTETLQQGQQQNVVDGTRVNEGLPHWQQQHCLIPQLPYNTSTPISWSH